MKILRDTHLLLVPRTEWVSREEDNNYTSYAAVTAAMDRSSRQSSEMHEPMGTITVAVWDPCYPSTTSTTAPSVSVHLCLSSS